jgi:hypothetical protein
MHALREATQGVHRPLPAEPVNYYNSLRETTVGGTSCTPTGRVWLANRKPPHRAALHDRTAARVPKAAGTRPGLLTSEPDRTRLTPSISRGVACDLRSASRSLSSRPRRFPGPGGYRPGHAQDARVAPFGVTVPVVPIEARPDPQAAHPPVATKSPMSLLGSFSQGRNSLTIGLTAGTTPNSVRWLVGHFRTILHLLRSIDPKLYSNHGKWDDTYAKR